MTSDKPYRIEFFDEEVDSIRYFDPLSQRSTEKVEEARISPARELVLEEKNMQNGVVSLRKSLESALVRLKSLDEEVKENLKSKIAAFLDKLEEGLYDETLESYFPFSIRMEPQFFNILVIQPLLCSMSLQEFESILIAGIMNLKSILLVF